MEPTPLFGEILEAVGDLKPKTVGIASAANVFAGSEIDRSQVQQFIDLLSRIALRANGSVVLISHPSIAGINTDTGLSGNTQWHNAVRARFYMKYVKPEKGELPDNDLREIVFKKNQYGSLSNSILLRYQHGLFLPLEGVSVDQAVKEAAADALFLELLQEYRGQNRYHSQHYSSVYYAPKEFASHPRAKEGRLSMTDLARAMERLFRANKIWLEPRGPRSKGAHRLAIKE